jgi:hypothetical protein
LEAIRELLIAGRWRPDNELRGENKMCRNFRVISLLASVLPGLLPHVCAQNRFRQAHSPDGSYSVRIPWTDGTIEDAIKHSQAGTTIKVSAFNVLSTKDNKTHTWALVGTDPFAKLPSGTSIRAVILPLRVTIGSSVFDPTIPNACDSNVSALDRFVFSPLVANVPNLTINGVNVGTTQYINGFRRAEFWGTIGGSAAYQNPIAFTVGRATTISPGTHGITQFSGCKLTAIISHDWLKNYLQSTVIPSLQSSGAISPVQFAFFLLSNVVQSSVDPPTTSQCCVNGFHTATGNPPQTYAVAEWDTNGNSAKRQDASVVSHEIGEWMDDPFATNDAPAWGGIGQQSGCQTNWENGDPLSGTFMPTITIAGKGYHVQELAFYDWFFAKKGATPVGTGGKFSSNGTFTGPAKPCPPGGTY